MSYYNKREEMGIYYQIGVTTGLAVAVLPALVCPFSPHLVPEETDLKGEDIELKLSEN